MEQKIDLRGKDEQQLSVELTAKNFRKVEDCYDYLLTIQIRSMTSKRLEQLKKELQTTKDNLTTYEKWSPADLWKKELEELLTAWKNSPFSE